MPALSTTCGGAVGLLILIIWSKQKMKNKIKIVLRDRRISRLS